MPRSMKPSGRRLGHRTAVAGPRAVRLFAKPAIQIIDPDEILGVRDRALIGREARKLATFADRIVEIQVTVTAPHRRLHGEVIRYQVRVHLTVPLEDLAVKRQEDVSLLTAAQRAFDAARRMLQDYVRRHRPPPSPVEGAAGGWVARLFPYEGFGFIEGDDGAEVYFHRHSVLDDRFDAMAVGRRVRYAAESGRKGIQASTVAYGRPRPKEAT